MCISFVTAETVASLVLKSFRLPHQSAMSTNDRVSETAELSVSVGARLQSQTEAVGRSVGDSAWLFSSLNKLNALVLTD